MKRIFLFVVILLIATSLRFYKLGSFPSGLTWDEAAIGYNAYGILTNHRDEWLARTPIVFRSFGDYKSPLLIYLTVFPVAIFGLTPFAVRVVVALSGVGLVAVSYFLADEILKSNKKQSKIIPFIVMFCVAISPWAIQYSRIGFESMLATFLVALGVLFWLKGKERAWLLIAGDVSFVVSLYAYHSAKIVVPVIALILCILFYKQFRIHTKQLIVGTLVSITLLAPLGYATFFGKANDRALSTTVFGQPHAVSLFFSHLVTQWSLPYLLKGEDITYRHGTREVGILYPVELILVLIGIYSILRDSKYRAFWWIPAFFFVSSVPAALGIDVPHSNRALLGLPWAQLTEGIGLLWIFEFMNKRQGVFGSLAKFLRKELFAGALLLVLLLSVVSYIHIYKRVYASSIALQEMGYGYEEAIAYTRSKEGEVSKVFFTNSYGQAYIYLLFFKHLTPIEYRGGGLANYTITDHPFEDARGNANVLVVGTPDQIPETVSIVKEVKFPDGKVAFRIARQ